VDLGKDVMRIEGKWSWIFLSGTIFRRVRKIASSDHWLRKVCLSVRSSARNNSSPTSWICA